MYITAHHRKVVGITRRMSNFALRSKQEDRIKWNREKRKQLAVFFFDVSKLFMGGWVVGSAVPMLTDDYNERIWFVIPAGLFVSVVSALIGKMFLK